MILTLFFYAVAAFGFAYIVGQSRVLLGLRTAIHDSGRVGRWLVGLVECPACLGFWTGFFVGSRVHPVEMRRWVFMFCLGFFTTGANFMLGKWTGLIGGGEEYGS